MKKNMGLVDRIIRVLIAVAIAVLYFTNQIQGSLAMLLEIVAAIFVATSFVSYCPLYSPFGISTRKKS
jgi:hypothetical protein